MIVTLAGNSHRIERRPGFMDANAARLDVRTIHSLRSPASEFIAHGEKLQYTTEGAPQFIDITADVRDVVERSAIGFGQVAVYSMHTTVGIIVNEHEPLLLNDMKRLLARTAQDDDYYEHNDFSIRTVNMRENEPKNGHSHLQQLFLGTSETIPVHDGEPQIGRYQSIFLVELDRPLDREVFVQVLGMALPR